MTRRQKRGLVLVLLGLTLVLCAVGIHLAERQQDNRAGESARILLEQLEQNRAEVVYPSGSVGESARTETLEGPEEDAVVDTEMPEKSFYGYAMIGTVRVPSVGIRLPVLSKWSYSLLDVAPCRYSGSLPGGDMIVMGHNYKSHFTPLHYVKEGAEVEFEDVNGVVSSFRVAEILVVHKSEKDKLESEYPLTLFTCMPNGRDRILLRCEAVTE